jgi:hypothetical protein
LGLVGQQPGSELPPAKAPDVYRAKWVRTAAGDVDDEEEPSGRHIDAKVRPAAKDSDQLEPVSAPRSAEMPPLARTRPEPYLSVAPVGSSRPPSAAFGRFQGL